MHLSPQNLQGFIFSKVHRPSVSAINYYLSFFSGRYLFLFEKFLSQLRGIINPTFTNYIILSHRRWRKNKVPTVDSNLQSQIQKYRFMKIWIGVRRIRIWISCIGNSATSPIYLIQSPGRLTTSLVWHWQILNRRFKIRG